MAPCARIERLAGSSKHSEVARNERGPRNNLVAQHEGPSSQGRSFGRREDRYRAPFARSAPTRTAGPCREASGIGRVRELRRLVVENATDIDPSAVVMLDAYAAGAGGFGGKTADAGTHLPPA